MNTAGCACGFGAALMTFAVATSQGQVSEAVFPTSILNGAIGNYAGVIQTWIPFTPYPGSFNYGQGNNANGVSGTVQHVYSGGQLSSITVNVAELRAQYGAFVPYNDPSAHNWGRVQFTPAVNTPYVIGGSVSMVLSGSAASSHSAAGSVWLEEVGGPTVASFGSSMFRNTNTSVIGSIYDSASPLFGSATGTLQAGVTYRLNWDFTCSGLINLDQGMFGNVFSLDGPQNVSISFVPSPGAAGVMGMAGIGVLRRRRR